MTQPTPPASARPAEAQAALWLGQYRIGAVKPALGEALAAAGVLGPRAPHADPPAWQVQPAAAPEDALQTLAHTLRRLGLCGPWRDERIAVWALPPDEPLWGRDEVQAVTGLATAGPPSPAVVGRIERATARVLGLQTQAVHLVGLAPGGRVWLQQRSMTKPDDPGLWDTLVGGLVPADEPLEQALARETQEEASLSLPQLDGWAWGGALDLRHATVSGGHPGWVRERVHWAVGTLRPGEVPVNQDGEVARFDLVTPAAVVRLMAAGQVTRTASAILSAALGLRPPASPLPN